MREPEIDSAAVDVELVAKVLAGHRRAFQMPARPAASPRGVPGCGFRLVRLVTLPEREVPRIPLASRFGVLGGLHVVDLLPGQPAVVRPGPDVEVDVTGTV